MRILLAAVCLLATGVAAQAQFTSEIYHLTDAEQKELRSGCDKLGAEIAELKRSVVETSPLAARLPDAEIYFEAVDRNLRLGSFFGARQVEQARACLKEGRARVEALKHGETPWTHVSGAIVVLGHRSAVDGSAQTFSVYVPAGHRLNTGNSPQPLDIFLHGRGGNFNELTFISSTQWLDSSFGKGTAPTNLVLYPYGRANNGWRFAGETDLYESLAAVRKLCPLDENRISLRGFSMGGHGAWQIGLHHPGEWSVVAPGAGFVDTKQYQKLTKPFPKWQDDLLHLYDPIDYVANSRNVPVLAYMGDKDPKFAQHKLIMAAFQREGAPVREFVGKDTEHKYEPGSLVQILDEMSKVRRDPNSKFVDFITYTTRFATCKWVRIDGMERHWDLAEVRAKLADGGRIDVTTRNVSSLTLTPPGMISNITIDGMDLPVASREITLVKQDGKWSVGRLSGLRKTSGLSGPIDDALFGPVLAVKGCYEPWTPRMRKWTNLELQRFREGFGEFFRGNLPEIFDAAVTPEIAASHNLYLFGDPGSNAYLRAILPELPIEWTKDRIVINGHTYATDSHLPMFVFPNPKNASRYVVINCGFTFSREDWHGSNARQYPHLPDWAVIRYDAEHFTDDRSTDVVAAGFFNEQWKIDTR